MSSFGSLVWMKLPNAILQIRPSGWLDIKLKHWWACFPSGGVTAVQCPFIYQFTEITSLKSKSFYVLLLQAQHSSAHPLSPSRTDVSKRVWLNRNHCTSVAWFPWTLASNGGEEKCVSKWEWSRTYTAYCSTFFFFFLFFFSLAFAGTWKWIAVFVQMAQNLKAICGDKVTRGKWRFFITLQRAGEHIYIVYTEGEIQNILLLMIQPQKKKYRFSSTQGNVWNDTEFSRQPNYFQAS